MCEIIFLSRYLKFFVSHQNKRERVPVTNVYFLYLFHGTYLSCFCQGHRVHTEWQRPLSGVHSSMIEKLAQAGEGEGARPPPCHYSYHAVYAPAEKADTLTLFHLYPYVLCGQGCVWGRVWSDRCGWCRVPGPSPSLEGGATCQNCIKGSLKKSP